MLFINIFKMSRFKILFLIFAILNCLNFIFAHDDDDLTLEGNLVLYWIDEPINKENTNIEVESHKYPKKNIQEDSDEFDNPVLLERNIQHPHPQMKPSTQPKQTKVQTVELDSNSPMTLAYYEIFMILFVATFLLNCLLGKKTNETLAERWYKANKTFYESNYAHLGAGTEYNPETFTPILKESYNSYKFYASGRVFTKWMLVNMEVTYLD